MQLLAVLALVGAWGRVSGHAVYMGDKGIACVKRMEPGTVIMGSPAVQSPDAVIVTRGDLVLTSGSTYVPGETLHVSSNHPGEVVFEVAGGGFRNGLCSGANRVLPGQGGGADFVAPEDGFDVKVWAGYGTGYGVVHVTSPFVLKGTKGARAALPPAAAPSKNATAADPSITNTSHTKLPANATTTAASSNNNTATKAGKPARRSLLRLVD